MYVTIDLCLLCLASKTDLKSIFSTDNDGILIEKKLNYFLLERVHIDPDISKYICLPCLQNINFFYNYKKQCLQNINTLNSYIYKLKYAKVPRRNKLQITLIDIKNVKLNRENSENKISEPITTENNNLANAVEIDQTKTEDELQDQHKQTTNDELSTKDDVESESDDFSDKLALECTDVPNNVENITRNMEPMPVDDKLKPTFVEVNVKTEPVDANDEINITPVLHDNSQNETGQKNTPGPLNTDLDLKYKDKLDTTFVEVPIKVEPNEYFYDGIESTSNIQDESQSAYNSNSDSQFEASCSSNNDSQNVTTNSAAGDEILPFKCTYCPERFRKKYLLKKHLGLHTGGRPYECTHCPKKFKTSAHLGRHLFLHGDKPFKCDVCYRLYSNEEDLVSHKHRAHISEKPFVCNICYKRFTSNCDLIRHTNVHTGERSYRCKICKKPFTRIDNLNKHLKSHSGKQLKCSICPFTCSAAYYLHRHLKTHKTNETAENDSSEDEPETNELQQSVEVDKIFIKEEYVESDSDNLENEVQPKPKDIAVDCEIPPQQQNVSLATKCTDNIDNSQIQEESIITGNEDTITDDKLINPTFDKVLVKEEPKVNFYDEINSQSGLDYGLQFGPQIAAAYNSSIQPQIAAAYNSIIQPQIEAPYNLSIGPQTEMAYNNNPQIAAAYNSNIVPQIAAAYTSNIQPQIAAAYTSNIQAAYNLNIGPQPEIAYNNSNMKPQIQAAYSLNAEAQPEPAYNSSGVPRIKIAYNSNGELQIKPSSNPIGEAQITPANDAAHASTSDPKPDDRRFKCTFCSKKFKKRSYLNNHVRLAHGNQTEKRHKCTMCSKGFDRRANLVRHHRLIHKKDESYRCDICQKPYISEATLEKHMLTHTNDTPYVCNICFKGFTNASSLRNHTLEHTGEKLYKCEVCDEVFTSSLTLNVHMRNHANVELFNCSECPFKTTSTKELNHHKYMHILPHLPFQEKDA